MGVSGGEGAYLREAPLPQSPLPEERLGISLTLPSSLRTHASWARFPAAWLRSRRLTEPLRPLQRGRSPRSFYENALILAQSREKENTHTRRWGDVVLHPKVRRRVQSSIRLWKRQKPTASGWTTICSICSAYCLSAQSRARTLKLMICSPGQKK